MVVLTRRNLVHITREPLQLSDVTVQPVLFTLLFVYVFGSGVPIHGGSYKDFAIAGLMLLNLTTSAMGTAVGLISDLTTGAIDRFRTLPMWRSAVLVGRSVADLLSAAICIGIVALTGLAIGWRPDASAASILAGFGVALLFSYALSWACACLGIVSKGPESAQGIGLIILFPLAIVSNAMVPTSGMPGWLQVIANWNPVSCRHRRGAAPLRQSQTRRARCPPGRCSTRSSRHCLVAGDPRSSSPPWPRTCSDERRPADASRMTTLRSNDGFAGTCSNGRPLNKAPSTRLSHDGCSRSVSYNP